MMLDGFRKSSLVRRLVILAAGWSLTVLLVSALVLALLFQQAALRRFDEGLAELIDNLLAGTTVDESGQVLAPALTDLRALRAYSGRYWQVVEPLPDGQWRIIGRPRSLWDAELVAPEDLVAQLAASPGRPVIYETPGPISQPLRAMASRATLPGREAPLIFMAAEDRSCCWAPAWWARWSSRSALACAPYSPCAARWLRFAAARLNGSPAAIPSNWNPWPRS